MAQVWKAVPHEPLNSSLLPRYWEVVVESQTGHVVVLGKVRPGGHESIEVVVRLDYAISTNGRYTDLRIPLAHAIAQSLSRLAYLHDQPIDDCEGDQP